LVDWGKAFVDANGSFYAGTTEQQKDNAVEVSKGADLIIYCADIHSRTSTEFSANGGLYPAHNLVSKDHNNLESLGVQEGKTVSPQLTDKLYELVKDRKAGLIVPKHVFYQDYNGDIPPKPVFSFSDVSDTFGVEQLDAQEFLDGKVTYVVNAKHMFNGAALQDSSWIPDVEGVSSAEENVFSLLKQKYGQGEGLEFNINGVVMGICVYQTASGIKQIFPKASVNVIYDACTHLEYSPLGIESSDVGNFVAKKMCQQVGVNYMSTLEYMTR